MNGINTGLYSEISRNLFLGGTDDADTVLNTKRNRNPFITKKDFDTVITAYAWANPCDWGVKEIRTTFYDGDMSDINWADLYQAVDIAYVDWQNGLRVLLRCQMGANRSGLLMTLLLRKHGYTSNDAIALLREKRSTWVLCNPEFEKWLLELDDPLETGDRDEKTGNSKLKQSQREKLNSCF